MGEEVYVNLNDPSQPQNISMGKSQMLRIDFEGGDLRNCLTKNSIKGNTLTLNVSGKEYKIKGVTNNTGIHGTDVSGPFSENLQGFYENFGTNIDWFSGGTSAKPITNVKGTAYGDSINASTSSFLPPNAAVTVDGGAGNDLIIGSDNNDKLVGGADNDSIYGGYGNDSISAVSGNNYLDGGYGNDSVAAGTGNDTIIGGLGVDSIVAGKGTTTIKYDGSFETDFITTAKGGTLNIVGLTSENTQFYKDSSNKNDLWISDSIKGSVILKNYLAKDTGADINLGSNKLSDVAQIGANIYDFHDKNFKFTNKYTGTFLNDSIDADLTPILDDESKMKIVNKNGLVIDGGEGNDTISGSQAKDKILGGAGDDSIVGGQGNDSISAVSGDNYIDGGDDNDSIVAGAGNDTLIGGEGDDFINAGAGNNSIVGGQGNDTLIGGADNDTIISGSGSNSITGGAGNNTLVVDSESSFNTVVLTKNENLNIQGLSFDSVSGAKYMIDSSNKNNLLINHNKGQITVNNLLSAKGTGAEVNINGEKLSDVAKIDINISDSENFNDKGMLKTNKFTGTVLSDSINGGSITSSVTTAKGLIIDSGAGNDTIIGSELDDKILGGEGNNSIVGGQGNDSISAVSGDNYIDGGDDNDSIVAGAGNDTLIGGEGDDFINAGAGNNSIVGGQGNDTLIGGADNDTIISGSGSNSITGGAGENTLYVNSESWAFNSVNLTKNEIMNIKGITFESIDSVPGGKRYLIDSTNKNNLLIDHDGGMIQLNNFLSAKGTGAEVNLNDEGNLLNVAKIVTDLDNSENYNAKGKLKTNKFTGTILGDSISGGAIEKEAITAKNLVIDGGEGNDTLVGSVVSDSVVGGIGNDVIYGGGTAPTDTTVDTIVGGLGNDILYGGTGDNKYVFNLGDGNDSILGGGSNKNDAAVFTKGTNIEVGYNDNDLIIEYSGLVKKETVSNEITVKDYDEDHGLQKITVGKTTKDIKDYMAGDNNHTVTSFDETTSVKILENGGDDTLIFNADADDIRAILDVRVVSPDNYSYNENSTVFIHKNAFSGEAAKNAIKCASLTAGPQPYGVNVYDTSGTGIETLQTTINGTLEKEIWFDEITAQVGGWLYDNGFADVQAVMDDNNPDKINALIEKYSNVTYTASLEP